MKLSTVLHLTDNAHIVQVAASGATPWLNVSAPFEPLTVEAVLAARDQGWAALAVAGYNKDTGRREVKDYTVHELLTDHVGTANDYRRAQALAKLTPEDRKVLGL